MQRNYGVEWKQIGKRKIVLQQLPDCVLNLEFQMPCVSEVCKTFTLEIMANGFVIMAILQVNTIQNEPSNAFSTPLGHEFVTPLDHSNLV